MDINSVHLKYEELNKDQVINKSDTTSFAQVAFEIGKLYEWENQYFHALEYRNQLPEKIQESIMNEFLTTITTFQNIVNLRASSLGQLEQQKPGIVSSIKTLYKTLYSLFAQDYRSWRFLQEGDSIIEKIKTNSVQVEKDLEKVKKQTDETVTNIVGAEATEEWAQEYSEYIFPDVLLAKEVRAIDKIRKKHKETAKGWSKYLTKAWCFIKYNLQITYISQLKGIIFYSGHSYFNISRRWRFWRSVFYVLLIAIAITYICYSLEFLNNTNSDFDSQDLIKFAMEKLTFLPIVVLAAIGMAFSSKNYKINSNLLEDYKHRYLVAKTVQNILRLPNIKKSIPLQNQFLSSGTSVIFEHRASGYNGKDSDEKLLQKLVSHMESINIKTS